ncbi:hypothetical protein IJ541_10000 [bacterium]|nr:hypothetical protein [bacterium]
MRSESVKIFDRVISVISYLTAGWGGVVFCVLMYFGKKKMSYFVKYNIFQSIFLSLIYFCIAMLFDIILKILSVIPFLNYFVAQIAFLLNRPFLGEYSILQTLISGLVLYLVVFSLVGKYPKIYGIAPIIERAAR